MLLELEHLSVTNVYISSIFFRVGEVKGEVLSNTFKRTHVETIGSMRWKTT